MEDRDWADIEREADESTLVLEPGVTLLWRDGTSAYTTHVRTVHDRKYLDISCMSYNCYDQAWHHDWDAGVCLPYGSLAQLGEIIKEMTKR